MLFILERGLVTTGIGVTRTRYLEQSVLRVEEISTVGDLSRYRHEWQALAAESERSDFFQTYEWLTTWLESFWTERPIAFLFLWDNDVLSAVVPLLRDEKGSLWCAHSLVFPNNEHGGRVDLLHRGDPEQPLGCALDYLSRQNGGTRIALRLTDKTSAISSVLSTISRQHHMRTIVTETHASPVIRVEGDWESYLKSRSRHLRGELRRKRKKVEQAGKAEWMTITTLEQCDRTLTDVFQIEQNSWKEDTGSSFTARATLSQFYSELARRCARHGWLRLYLLYLDGQPVAHVYGVFYKNEYYALKTSYDQAYQKLSPGSVLFEYALQELWSAGVQVVDFLGVEARWKNSLATDYRSHVRVCLYSSHLPRCRMCDFYHQQLKPLIKNKAPLVVKARRMLKNALSSGN